jgi:DNA ligase-1
MSEKFDGVRAFWNGKCLLSRTSKEFACPKWFTEELPQDIYLDGELWMDRRMFEQLNSVVLHLQQNWDQVQYVVFDLPKSNETYEQRMEQLQQLQLPPHVKKVEVEQCQGNAHLTKTLNTILKLGGEGIMLNRSNSLYSATRTSSLLKVKVHLLKQNLTLTFERSLITTAKFSCWKCSQLDFVVYSTNFDVLTFRRPNSIQSIIGCNAEVCNNPPEVGSVLTVKHSGYFSNGTLRHPYFWRERKDISWKDISKEESPKVEFN